MTPTALANNISNSAHIPWQPIPASAALNSNRNGNGNGNGTIKNQTINDLRNKPFYGVRPTQNIYLNNNNNKNLAIAPSSNQFLFKF